jgi:hypothetical protein
MNNPLIDYYRCEEQLADFYRTGELSGAPGFFRLGESVCYGQCNGGPSARTVQDPLCDYADHLQVPASNATIVLPFDPGQIITNLRTERYTAGRYPSRSMALFQYVLHRSYYLVRPLLPVPVRRHFQKLHLHSREKAHFPQWPVDCTVDNLLEQFLHAAIRANRQVEVPFIWFWPEGMSSAAIMTHDVETRSGLDFCEALMDLNDEFAIKSSFQIIPESRYAIPPNFLARLSARGFEVNVHDLNHDGHLFRDRDEFLRRIAKINRYISEFDAQGFRSGVMYRNQEWFADLEAAYDMSVPNAAHLDPQFGGCCTVMPYFVGDLLELPVTTTQDYALFNLLTDYSIDLWRREIEMVQEKHGLISFVVHPDYVIDPRPRATYRALLEHLSQIRAEGNVWFARPREINEWWRQRNQMRLVRSGTTWSIEGPGCERARVAHAEVDGNYIRYSIQPPACQASAAGRGSQEVDRVAL